MKKPVRTLVLVCSCLVLITVFVVGLLPQCVYAQTGAEIKAHIQSLIVSQSQTAEEQAQFEALLNQKNYFFTAPESFKQIPATDTSSTNGVFISELNPYETPSRWKSMTVQERVACSKIPAKQIHTMSTDNLILSTMNYNLLCDLFLYNTIQEGFDAIKQQYNGLAELNQRSDGAERLIELYKAIDLNVLFDDDRFSTLRVNFLEMVLAQDEIIKSLSDEESRGLVLECLNKVLQVSETQKGNYGISTTLYLGLRCLYEHDAYVRAIINESEGLLDFITTSRFNLNNISDETIGKLTIYFQNNYLGGGQ